MKYVFETMSGNRYTVISKDHDRARCTAKKQAGPDWRNAKLVAISNAL